MKVHLAAGIAGGVTLLVAAVVTLTNDPPRPSISVKEAPSPATQVQSARIPPGLVPAPESSTVTRPPTSTPHRRPSPSAQLLDRYNGTGNRRQFAVEAWGKPDEGGRYYADRVANQCLAYRRFSEFPTEPGARETEASVTARNGIQASCDGFTDDELTHHYRLRPGNSRTDPIAAASRAVSAANRSGSFEEKLSAIQAVLDLGDPVLIDDLGIRVALHRNETVGTYVYFEGVRYPVRDDPAIVSAFALLPCALGLDCGRHDPALALSCASAGRCYVDRFEKVAAETSGGRSGQRFTEVLQWYEKLASAVKRRDASAFVDRS